MGVGFWLRCRGVCLDRDVCIEGMGLAQPAREAGDSIKPRAERGFASEALGRMFVGSVAREADDRSSGLNS